MMVQVELKLSTDTSVTGHCCLRPPFSWKASPVPAPIDRSPSY